VQDLHEFWNWILLQFVASGLVPSQSKGWQLISAFCNVYIDGKDMPLGLKATAQITICFAYNRRGTVWHNSRKWYITLHCVILQNKLNFKINKYFNSIYPRQQVMKTVSAVTVYYNMLSGY
jgi:hypothetical protein